MQDYSNIELVGMNSQDLTDLTYCFGERDRLEIKLQGVIIQQHPIKVSFNLIEQHLSSDYDQVSTALNIT